MPEHSISVLLVDDHQLVRRGFRRMLEDEPDIQVVGEAGDGAEAVERAKELRPNVVVMDFALPSMNGAVATARILTLSPAPKVLLVGSSITHADLIPERLATEFSLPSLKM